MDNLTRYWPSRVWMICCFNIHFRGVGFVRGCNSHYPPLPRQYLQVCWNACAQITMRGYQALKAWLLCGHLVGASTLGASVSVRLMQAPAEITSCILCRPLQSLNLDETFKEEHNIINVYLKSCRTAEIDKPTCNV